MARHNFTTYMVRDFDLEVMNFGQLGLLLVKGFSNEAELNHYRSLLSRDRGVIIPEGVRPVQISKSNFEKLLGEADRLTTTSASSAKKPSARPMNQSCHPKNIRQHLKCTPTEPNTETPEAPQSLLQQSLLQQSLHKQAPQSQKRPKSPNPPALPKTPSSPKTPKTPTPPKKPTSPPVYPDYPLGSEGDED